MQKARHTIQKSRPIPKQLKNKVLFDFQRTVFEERSRNIKTLHTEQVAQLLLKARRLFLSAGAESRNIK